MAQFPILRLTHAGHEMSGMSQGGGKLTFVRVELGDGWLKEEDSIEALTGLKRSAMQLPLQGYLNEGNGKARLRFVIDNSALTVGFHNREVGIFAKIDNGAERLYAYTNAGNYADWIPSKETPIDGDIVDLHIVIGNAANVTIQTVSGAYATKIELEEHRTAAELDHPEKSVHKKHLHQDTYESPAFTGTPTVPTAGKGTNNGQIASTAFVAQAIAALVNSAPGALDTLQELAAALGNDANFAATITNALAGKLGKTETAVRASALEGWSLERNRTYQVGDIAYHKALPSWARLECVKAGITGAAEPTSLATVTKAGQLITDGTAVWIIDDVRDGARVGDIILRPTLRDGYIKANGATVKASEYPRLLAWAQESNMTATAEQYAQDCSKYVYDAAQDKLTLPNAVGRVLQGGESAKSVEAGLPNITGKVYDISDFGDESYHKNEGAMTIIKGTSSGIANINGGNRSVPAGINFDASRSNPIYGRSNTVQPPAITMIAQIKY